METSPITVYPKKYAHGFVVLCFVVVTQSFIMNSHEVFIHIHQGCFAGTGAIVGLPQCQWSKPDWYGKISLCITTTKHSKAKTVCIFLGIYCTSVHGQLISSVVSSANQYCDLVVEIESKTKYLSNMNCDGTALVEWTSRPSFAFIDVHVTCIHDKPHLMWRYWV